MLFYLSTPHWFMPTAGQLQLPFTYDTSRCHSTQRSKQGLFLRADLPAEILILTSFIWMHTCQQVQHSCCNLHAMKLVLPHACLQTVAQKGQNQNLSHLMVSFKKEPTSQHLTYYAIPIVAETKLLHLQFKNFVHNHSTCKIRSSCRN